MSLLNSNFQFFALNAATACSKAPAAPRLIRSQMNQMLPTQGHLDAENQSDWPQIFWKLQEVKL
jgi:hypothetical protein